MTNDEAQHAEFIEEQRTWLKAYRVETDLSWPEIAKRTGTERGTISQFGGEKGYNGRELPLAEAVQRFRDLLNTRDTTFLAAPEVPGYFETQTSVEIINLLHWCQRGKMVCSALGSGLGKSKAAEHFKSRYNEVFIATLWESEGSQGPMQQRILLALGVKSATGTPRALSRMVCDKLSAMHKPVLIIDEAQHLTVKALEEIRGWHDETGAGIAFFGDQRLAHTINNGTGKNDLPQLRRRLKSMPMRMQPYGQDVTALAAAWDISEKRMIVELGRIAQRPGGLGLATQALEMAALIAAAEQKAMDLSHLQEAAADVTRSKAA